MASAPGGSSSGAGEAAYWGEGGKNAPSLRVFRPFTLYSPPNGTCSTGLCFSLSTPSAAAGGHGIKAISVNIQLTSQVAPTSILHRPRVMDARPTGAGEGAGGKRRPLRGFSISVPPSSSSSSLPSSGPPDIDRFARSLAELPASYFAPWGTPTSPASDIGPGLKLETSSSDSDIRWNLTTSGDAVIPSDLPFALLVHHDGAFVATITVNARAATFRSALRSSPTGSWSIVFDGAKQRVLGSMMAQLREGAVPITLQPERTGTEGA